MPSPPVSIGTGASITFGTSGFTAEILDITLPDMTREPVNVSHLGTTFDHIYIPVDLVENNELAFDVHLNPDTVPPIHDVAETVTVDFRDGASWSFSGFMTKYGGTNPLEDKLMASVAVKVTGGITQVAAP